jgi:hypothetical protein
MHACRGSIGLVALVVAYVGCSSESPQTKFVGEFCDLLKPCCTAAGLKGDGQQCRLLFGFGASGYNAAAGDACLAELKAMPPAALCASGMDSPTCSMVFPSTTGTKMPGATCESDSDCAPSSQGKVSCAFAFSGTTINKCQVQVRGQDGSSPCVGTVDGSVTSSTANPTDVVSLGYLCYTDDGLRCDSSSACVKLKTAGQTCTSQFAGECVPDARCDSTAQSCVARKPVGATCTGAQDECVAAAYCKSTVLTCAPKLANGTACTASAECVSDNCDMGTGTGPGTCKAGFGDLGLVLICGSP